MPCLAQSETRAPSQSQQTQTPAQTERTLTISEQADQSALVVIGARVIEEAFRRADLKVVWKPLPLQRAIEEANDGVVDGDMHRIADVAAAFPNVVIVPTPVSKAILAIYGRSPALPAMNRAQIMKLRVGYPRGLLVAKKYSKGMDVIESSVYSTIFDMLFEERVDVVMLNYVESEMIMARSSLPHPVTIWPHAWASEPLHLVLNKRNADLVPRLDDVLRQMKQEGRIEKIYDDTLREFRIKPLPFDDGKPAR